MKIIICCSTGTHNFGDTSSKYEGQNKDTYDADLKSYSLQKQPEVKVYHIVKKHNLNQCGLCHSQVCKNKCCVQCGMSWGKDRPIFDKNGAYEYTIRQVSESVLDTPRDGDTRPVFTFRYVSKEAFRISNPVLLSRADMTRLYNHSNKSYPINKALFLFSCGFMPKEDAKTRVLNQGILEVVPLTRENLESYLQMYERSHARVYAELSDEFYVRFRLK